LALASQAVNDQVMVRPCSFRSASSAAMCRFSVTRSLARRRKHSLPTMAISISAMLNHFPVARISVTTGAQTSVCGRQGRHDSHESQHLLAHVLGIIHNGHEKLSD
jgi:hypothetical protein